MEWDTVDNMAEDGDGYTVRMSANDGSSWTKVYPSSGTTGPDVPVPVNNPADGSYEYEVQATNSAGQSGWSSPVTMSVAILPGKPTISALTSPNTTGNYTVSWGTTSRAVTYVLEQSTNGGSWSTKQSNSNHSWPANGMAPATYQYRVEARNIAGNSSWSGTVSVFVVPRTTLTATASPADTIAGDSYSVSWNAASGTTYYELEYTLSETSPGHPNWSGSSPVNEGTSRSLTATAPPVSSTTDLYYRARACVNSYSSNISTDNKHCGGWSAQAEEVVTPQDTGCPPTMPQQQTTGGVSPQIIKCNGTTQTGYNTKATPPAGTESSRETTGVATVALAALPPVPAIAVPPETSRLTVPAVLPDAGITLPRSVTDTDTAADTTHGLALRTADAVPNAAPALQTTPAAAGSTLPPGDPIATWDGIGQARSITAPGGTFNLNYGPDGDLIENTGTDGGRYLGHWVKLSETNNDWHARIIVNGAVVAVVTSNAGTVSTSYLIQDALGSTAAVTNEDGTVTTRIAYDAWGNLVNPADGTTKVGIGVRSCIEALMHLD
ncbi:MAG: hypothetical protein ACRESU_01905 [Gammaproteobacteria bacterium]